MLRHYELSLAVCCFSLLICPVFAQQSPYSRDPFAEIAISHIRANVLDKKMFGRILKRDLASYFRNRNGKLINVEYTLLRDGPTQSGIAYPKFYVWVKVRGSNKLIEEGAARVAAVERKRFEVLNYLSKANMRKHPELINAVFPQPVCEKIRQHL